MKRLCVLIVACAFAMSCFAQETVTLEIKASETQQNWSSKQAKVLDKISNFSPNAKAVSDLNRYGSSLYLKMDSTGFYHTAKINDRWMMVDPDGYACVDVSVTSAYNLSGGALNDSEAQTLYDRLRELGFTGIGNFTNEAQTINYNAKAQNAGKQFSYTRAMNFYLTYKGQRRNYYPSSPTTSQLGNSGLDHIFVLDPAFITFCVSHAASMANYKNERNLLGYFTDNEINFNQDQLYNILKDISDVNDPSYKAALAYATSRGKTKEQILAAGKPGWSADPLYRDFAALLAERYYKITDSVMNIYDPNHLNLGSRLHGRPRAIEGVVKASAKYCDAVSANFYDNYCPNDELTSATKWESWIDKPVLIGEFYSKGLDAKTAGYVDDIEPGAGWIVKTQKDRGVWFQNTFIEFIKSKNVVGWHYFKYRDGSSDGSNKGLYAFRAGNGSLTNAQLEYTELTDAVAKINKQRYNILEHFHPGMLDMVSKKITAFSIVHNMQTYPGNIAGRSITVDLPDGIDPSTLIPFFSISPANAKLYVGSEEQESGNNIVDFVNNASYKFASRNAFDTTYQVVARVRPTFKKFSISSNWRMYDGVVDSNKISVTVPKEANPNTLIPSFELSPYAKAYVGSEEQESMTAPMIFTAPVTYRLQMPNGIENSYVVSVQLGEQQATGVAKSNLDVNLLCRNKTLFFSDIGGLFEVKVFSAQGICVESQTLNSSASLPLSQSGIFFVQVRQGEKSVVKKVVVQ